MTKTQNQSDRNIRDAATMKLGFDPVEFMDRMREKRPELVLRDYDIVRAGLKTVKEHTYPPGAVFGKRR